MPFPFVTRSTIAKAILDRISESIGTAIGFPDSTLVNRPKDNEIEIVVQMRSGAKTFVVKVQEKRT